jgi:peptidoglycan hydrolase-like protein with peptidoglycan-binding domain
MSRLVLAAVALALSFLGSLFCGDAALAERRVALVIGNSAYQHVPALGNPTKDAQAMAAMLQKAGFDVVDTQYNAGDLQLKRAIRQFEDAAADADIAIVYYAGLGIGINGAGYLIPVDAKLVNDRDADGEAVSLQRLADAVGKAKRLRLVIVDACRDNPFARTIRQQAGAAGQISATLDAPDPKPNTLIAYAATPESQAEDCNADSSPFTAALRYLFVRGLDIRLAFGRVREEVLRKTGNQQEPYVYGSLRRGGNTAIVPSPFQPQVDLQGEKSDYSLVEKIGTARAWQVFLLQHPTGFFSGDAREQLRLAEAEPAAPAQRPATRIPGANGEQEAACRSEEDRLRSLQAQGAGATNDLKALEQNLTCERLRPLVIAALDRAIPVPNVDTSEQVRSAQGQLIRLGCFAGTADGRLDAATIAALLLYLDKQGIKPSGDVHITDDLIAELTKQSARVCPLVCPPGKVAARGQCIDSTKGKPTVARPSGNRPAPQPTQPNPPPRTTEQKPAAAGGGAARIGVTPGVGF